MAIEAKRGCGYRKVGGLYLVCDPGGQPCERLPIPLDVCPCCGGGIKQTRGWTWIDPILFTHHPCAGKCDTHCPLADISRLGDRVGLLWVGSGFYPTPDHFETEAANLGISKRIAAVPRGFKVGETWIMLAHPTAATTQDEELKIQKKCPGIFRAFKPQRLEQLITETQSKDEVLMHRLEKQNITPVIVPDDDPDHRGTVYDKAKETDHE